MSGGFGLAQDKQEGGVMNYDASDDVDLYRIRLLEQALKDKKLYELVDLWHADQPHIGRLSTLKLAILPILRDRVNRPYAVEWYPVGVGAGPSTHFLSAEVLAAAEAERKQELEQSK